MEQFSLEKYLANPSRKIVTRGGRTARIICTDVKGTKFPIVVLITDGNEREYVTSVNSSGEANNDPSEADLFFAPERHEGWVNIYKSKYDGYELSQVYQRKEDAKTEKYINDSDVYIATVKIEWEE